MNKVLIIDDEEKLRSLLARLIKLEGFSVNEAANLKQAFKAVAREEPDVILCDVKLPDGNGIDFIKEIKLKHPLTEIVLLTAYGNIPDGVQAMKNGAFDYLVKGDDNNKIIPLLNRVIEKVELKKKVVLLQKQVGEKFNFESIIGSSPSITTAIDLAKKVAPTHASVLLLGETGTGKEVFAQAIHNASLRAGKNFVALNCSSFSKELLESELFGHTAGAFTGAVTAKKGLMEEASSGTLFLDEIGEMPLELQPKLLRVLETGEFIKVGDTQTTKIDVRIIAATNRDLEQLVEESTFREDLFYRLNVFIIKLPPLRERRMDIPALAQFFLKMFSVKTGNNITSMSEDFLEHLQAHEWKGNIRELKNIIERAVILADGPELMLKNLPLDLQSATFHSSTTTSDFDLAAAERSHIQKILQYTKGNKTEAARLLGIGLATLYRKIGEFSMHK